mgnify:CR=1 FL=1
MRVIDKLTAKYVNFNENTPLIAIPKIVTEDEWIELYLELKYGLNNVVNIDFGQPPNEPHDSWGTPLE